MPVSHSPTADFDDRAVLRCYPAACRPRDGRTEFLGAAGGYSGAQFWRFSSPAGLLCLRRWPREHPSVERLQFMQAVLWHVHQEGFVQIPLPLETREHAGFVRHAGHLWELTPWISGRADYHEAPSEERLQNALTALAGFHLAAASFPLPEAGLAPSPGILERRRRLEELLSGGLARLRAAIPLGDWPELNDRATLLLELFPRAAPRVLKSLHEASLLRVPWQPCLRDVWHDHVLFEGPRVTALIDCGALRAESVAGDIARLLGSLVADDPRGWQLGLAAYESLRPLAGEERRLVSAFDQSSVLLSGLNWLQWICVEGRQFEDRRRILSRIDDIVLRLRHLAEAK